LGQPKQQSSRKSFPMPLDLTQYIGETTTYDKKAKSKRASPRVGSRASFAQSSLVQTFIWFVYQE
ncbi:MAG: hypothetical protein IJ268_06355, partial [Proteobacteria bacterium]|nr:hypothetical protein [Pseudomonadota bacterium]